MRKVEILSILLMICLLVSILFPTAINKVYAKSKNEVTLNFEGGIIHDGYVEYSKKAKLQLFKGEDLVVNISNNMIIDLNEADYEFVIQEIPAEDTGSVVGPAPVKLNINDWYYATTTLNSKVIFKLESSKFSGTLDVKLVRTRTVVNTTVKNVYEDISSKGVIDLTDGKEYVIDFSKNDELTEGLKSFADLDKTLYYKRDNKGLLATDNESEAVIKIVGNKSENKVILTAVNVGTKKSEVFKGFHMQYTGSALNCDDLDGDIASGGIVRETRYDYYTRCTYDFTFQYVKEEVSPKEYKFTEGANQTYTIDESKNATFRIDADYSLFTNKVYVDNKLVDSTNYDSKSGSTVITLKDEYLKTLSVGEHTLKVAFSDNGEAITKFTIKEKQQGTNIEDNENTKNEENQENNNLPNNDVKKDNTITNTNPKTGDNVIVYFAMFSIALLGIITLAIVNVKRK
ncbi:putative LPXTG-motif protein cell wall anchor domain protein [Clostridium sp. CAG:452]|jgi:putative uncharacterized protein (fragment)|nr:putative LPXTG-motif protein cell wall anchor domain protein [Clostridium sp. CAG:452]